MNTEKQYETKVIIYKSDKDMQRGIKHEQKAGWSVIQVTDLEQGWSAGKTCCLGLIFLPLALLGKKPHKFQVLYQRPEES